RRASGRAVLVNELDEARRIAEMSGAEAEEDVVLDGRAHRDRLTPERKEVAFALARRRHEERDRAVTIRTMDPRPSPWKRVLEVGRSRAVEIALAVRAARCETVRVEPRVEIEILVPRRLRASDLRERNEEEASAQERTSHCVECSVR